MKKYFNKITFYICSALFIMFSSCQKKLDEAYVKVHAGDWHSAPEDHRARFPDGRVGSHSDLGTSEHGKRFFEVACSSGRSDYLNFLDDKTSNKSHASV